MYRLLNFTLFALLFSVITHAQIEIPKVYSNISINKNNELVLHINDTNIVAEKATFKYQLSDFEDAWKASEKGLIFESANKKLNGDMYFGLIPYGDSKFPQPVFFKRMNQLVKGKTEIKIAELFKGKYDMIGWEKSGKGVLGYRVISSKGTIIYNGLIGFTYKNNKFDIDLSLLEGPMINLLKSDGAVISFKTNQAAKCSIIVDNKEFTDPKATKKHEIKITGLQADKEYKYTVKYGNNQQSYAFRTAPQKGSRSPFIFAYASDSRGGRGGGERNSGGHNGYIVKKIMALAVAQKSRFVQFTGDLVSGYTLTTEEMNLEYANFKNTVSPFAHYIPLVVGMGNHEVINHTFKAKNVWASIDKFPFNTQSAESTFANNFTNPQNGPESEDGSKYDPDKNTIDFPSYKENVYYYTYDNTAIIVLNSNYLYAPSANFVNTTSGNIHGYIMDNQLEWLKQTLAQMEKDPNIDHVFVTIHTPAFPNGGHANNDMYYFGDNSNRAYIAGKAVDKGIIERRDQFLDLIINKSTKTLALLVGDEHNYNKLKLTDKTPIYPPNYQGKKLKIKRTFWQINNGAAGAPYYAQEILPWSSFVSGFTTQNALCLFYIDGKKVKMKVLNPDTLEEVDQINLR